MITFKWNEVIFPNTEVAGSEIENISQRKMIRQDVTLGLVYETDSEGIKKAMSIVRQVLTSKENVLDDIRVYFSSFWDFSQNLDITYFINHDLGLQDRLKLISDANFEIKEGFEKQWIEFAYPTQMIYSKKI